MIKVFITTNGLELNNELLDASPATVSAAKSGSVSDALRHLVRASLNEEVVLVEAEEPWSLYTEDDNFTFPVLTGTYTECLEYATRRPAPTGHYQMQRGPTGPVDYI